MIEAHIHCPACLQHVLPLTYHEGRWLLKVPEIGVVYSAQFRCPHCGRFFFWTAQRLPVGTGT